MPTKIEHMCKCKLCFVGRDGSWLRWPRPVSYADKFCPRCGYRLADDGFAYEMVRADSVVELGKELAIRDAALEMSVQASELFDAVSPAGWIEQAREEATDETD